MGAGFLVNGHHPCAGLDELRHKAVRLFNHQVAVQTQVRGRPQRPHDRGADGDVGHETAVHDIDVNHGGAAALDGFDLRTQPREISR